MQDIGEGTILECVHTKQNEWITLKRMQLTLGALYTVEHVVEYDAITDGDVRCCVDGCREPFLMLRGKGKYGSDRLCYCPSQFKPFGQCEEVEREHEELVPMDG